jgi:hypothetical protein
MIRSLLNMLFKLIERSQGSSLIRAKSFDLLSKITEKLISMWCLPNKLIENNNDYQDFSKILLDNPAIPFVIID